jgi:hypothetical protein
MLTRWEEYVLKKNDKFDRFLAKESLAFKYSFLERPIVNEYVGVLLKLFNHIGYFPQKKLNEYQIIPTHDIDLIHPELCLKNFIADIVKEKSLKKIFKRANRILDKEKSFLNFTKLMDYSEKYNLKSRFYFMSNGISKFDNKYLLKENGVFEIINEIKKRGHIIGFHPGYDTYINETEWERQYNYLKYFVGDNIKEGRQHFLRFEIPTTWRIWEKNGFEIDSSLMYAEKIGFRCGTANEFSVFNFLDRKKLKIKERPLILMESSLKLKKYENISIENSYNLVDYYKNIAKKYNMPLTILFHNSSFDELDRYKWDNIYEYILR